MAYYEMMPAGLPAGLQSGMDSVLNKKFGTATSYAPGTWPDTVNLMGPLPEKTIVSSPIADFSDGADDVPTKSLVVTIPATLTGVSSVSETRTGRNLLSPVLYDGGAYNPAVDSQRTFTESATQFTRVGNTFSISFSASWTTYTMLVPVKYGVSYYTNFSLSGTGTNLGTSVYYVDADGKVLASASNNTSNPQTRTFAMNVPSGAKYFCITFTNRGTAETTLTFTEPQLELGSTAHDYEPYQTPTTYTANLGRTIFGGEVDIVNGVGTAVYGRLVLNSDNMNIISRVNANKYRVFNADCGALVTGSDYADIVVSSPLRPQTGTANDDRAYINANGDIRMNFTAEYNSVVDMISAVGSITIVYPLATPTDFTFDGQEIDTMLGYNAFWSDEGDTEITYRADINLALGGN